MPAGLLGTGALVGGILAATMSAGAAPAANSPSPRPPGVPGYGAPWSGHPDGPGMRGHALDQTGTVTAVGATSVTIKTSKGTTTYAVTSTSDIDKNGEAKLSDLKVGDAVRFSSVTVSGKATIAILHAGSETLNRPQHRPGDRPHDGPPGSSGSSGSSNNQTSA